MKRSVSNSVQDIKTEDLQVCNPSESLALGYTYSYK